MSRPRRLILATSLTLLLLLAAGLGIVAILLGSEAGTRVVARLLPAEVGETVRWSKLEGPLLGPLRLVDLQVSLSGLELTADELHLSWSPWALLEGRAQVDALRATGIRLELTPTEPEPESSPFNPEDISLPVAVTLSGLSLSDLQIIQQKQTPVQIDSIELDATMVERQLDLHRLAVRLPEGGLILAANTLLAAKMPLKLEASWDWLLAQSADSTDTTGSVDTTAQLRGGLALEGEILWDEGIGFELHYQTRADGVQALNGELPATINAGGELAGLQTGDKLLLHKATLNLADTGPAIALSLTGQLTELSAAEPEARLTAQWIGLRWPLQAENPGITSNQGSIALAGSVSDYRLDLAAALAGQDIPASHWQLSGTGDTSQLTIDQLDAQLLGGDLAISGELHWDPQPRWNLQVTGQDIDPGQLLPELPGSLALALHTRGRIDPDTGPQLDLNLQNLNGTLLGYALQADARGEIAGDKLQLIALNLNSDGNTVTATGEVSATALDINWQLRATNPAGFVEGFAGEVDAQGAVAGNPEAPRLQMQATGTNLAWESYTLPSLDARLTAGLGTDDPLSLELITGPVWDGEEVLLSSLRVQAAGTTAAHRLDSAVQRSDEQLQLRLDGGVDRASGSWQGQLSQLSLHTTDYGQWQLVGPATLSLAAEQASAGQSCLQVSPGSGRVCILGNWLAGGSSAVRGRLQGIPLALFVPGISGDINGEVAAALAANGELRVDSTVILGSGEIEVQNSRSLTHDGGNLSLQVDGAGLLATLQLAAPEQGRLQANVKLPALTALPMAAEQPLSGSISAALPDLSGLAAWVPELGTSAGRLSADLRLQGKLSQPLLEGSLALHDGALTVPEAGLELDDIELVAASDPASAGLLAISGGMRSGPGQLVLSGAIDLDKLELDLALNGDHFEVYNTPDARALLSPQLQVGWQEQILTLRGQVTVPKAAITPKIQLRPTGAGGESPQEAIPGQVIAPSADVVVVSQTLEPMPSEQLPEAPFRIDSRMRLTMGEDVRVNAVGFVSDITGSVDFTNTPEQEALIPIANGRFSLKNGTFRAFGQDLDIETGHLIFADVPATEPELNLRAVRWIDNDPQVTAAGVMVTGPLTQPVLELFSRPQLETSEIQSYLLTGRSPRSRENVLGIGTYVAPRIYVGYGYNMLEKTSEFNSLFNISPRYGVGTSVGEADNNINLTITYEH